MMMMMVMNVRFRLALAIDILNVSYYKEEFRAFYTLVW